MNKQLAPLQNRLQTLLSASNIAYACKLSIKILISVIPRSGFTDFSCTVDVDVDVKKLLLMKDQL